MRTTQASYLRRKGEGACVEWVLFETELGYESPEKGEEKIRARGEQVGTHLLGKKSENSHAEKEGARFHPG